MTEKPTTIPSQTCWHCEHFYYEPEEQGYSEVTPGSPTSIECRKKLWAVDDVDRYTGKPIKRELSPLEYHEDFTKAMEIGFTCPAFTRRDGD